MTGTPFILRCDAGAEDGLGHLSRCLVLAEAAAALGAKPLFVTHGGAGDARIEAAGFARRAAAGPVGSVEDRADLTALCESFDEAPLILLDSRRLTAADLESLAGRAVTATIDDETPRDLPADLIANPNIWADESDYPERPGRTIAAGPAYALIRPAFFEPAEGPQGDPLSVLVTLGGEDPGNHTAWLLETLADLLAATRLKVVVGPAHPDPARVAFLLAEKLPKAELFRDPPSMVPLVRGANVALTAGGTTCYELAAARVAQGALVIEDHQARLVEALTGLGCAASLGRFDALDAEAARATVTRLLRDPEARAAQAAAQAEAFPRSGAAALAERLLGLWRERRETQADMKRDRQTA